MAGIPPPPIVCLGAGAICSGIGPLPIECCPNFGGPGTSSILCDSASPFTCQVHCTTDSTGATTGTCDGSGNGANQGYTCFTDTGDNIPNGQCPLCANDVITGTCDGSGGGALAGYSCAGQLTNACPLCANDAISQC